MKKITKKILAVILAAICTMNLTMVSFATSGEQEIFDEANGELYLNSKEQFEELVNSEGTDTFFSIEEVPVWYIDHHKDIRKINISKNFMAENEYELFYCLWMFPNIEEVIVDEEHPFYQVYDKGVYTKDMKGLLYYPLQSNDVDIVLHENTEYIYGQCFLNTYETLLFSTGYYPATDKEYNLYITRSGQLQEMIDYALGWDMNAESLYYARYANIYANETQETLDNLCVSEEKGYPFTIDTLYNLAISSSYQWYFILRGYLNSDLYPEEYEDLANIMLEASEGFDISGDESFEEMCEIYDIYSKRQVDGFIGYGFDEDFTMDEFEHLCTDEYSIAEDYIEMFGSIEKAYEFTKHVIDANAEHGLYLYNRGNPMKPLSTLTSGVCGEDIEWTINEEKTVLSITGTGAIADDYSGFDLFKNTVTKVEIDNGITAIGKNVFSGFDSLETTEFNGTQAEWDKIQIGENNEFLTKNVTVIPDEIVTPDTPEIPEEDIPAPPTFVESLEIFIVKVIGFFSSPFRVVMSWLEKFFR